MSLKYIIKYLLFERKLYQAVNFSWRTNKHLVIVVEKTFSTLATEKQFNTNLFTTYKKAATLAFSKNVTDCVYFIQEKAITNHNAILL